MNLFPVLLLTLIETCQGLSTTRNVPLASHIRQPMLLQMGLQHFGGFGSESVSSRTCLRQFITQRAIQSFMFLLGECRDPHSADWIERFASSHNLIEYHGTGAFNTTLFPQWDSLLLNMIENPVEKIIIQARRRGLGRGGWSKNNPYLQQDRFVEYEISVDPPSLVTRILSVREQITREIREDLFLILKSNENILDSYSTRMIQARTKEKENKSLDISSSSSFSNHDQLQDESTKNIFDRDAVQQFFRDNVSLEPLTSSPLRRGTFDLTLLLSMQESIHNVLKHYQSMGESKEVSLEFLRDFYFSKLDYFDGNVPYGRADDFLSQLLMTPPSFKLCTDGKTGLVDPLSITEEIIKNRNAVLRNWINITDCIPNDHVAIRKVLLSKQIGKVDTDSNSEKTSARQEESFE